MLWHGHCINRTSISLSLLERLALFLPIQLPEGLTATELEDLLYLKVNGSDRQFINRGVRMIRSIIASAPPAAACKMSADLVLQLLQHAIPRKNHILYNLCTGLPAASSLSPSAVTTLLLSAIELVPPSETRDPELAYEQVDVLCRLLPAAKQLGAAAIGSLLARAAEVGNYMAVVRLSSLGDAAVADALSAATVEPLLAAAVAADQPHIVDVLCDLSGAKQLGQGSLAKLLHGARHVWVDGGSSNSNKVSNEVDGATENESASIEKLQWLARCRNMRQRFYL